MLTRKQISQTIKTPELPSRTHHCQAVPGKTRTHLHALRLDDDEEVKFRKLLSGFGVKNLGEFVRKHLALVN